MMPLIAGAMLIYGAYDPPGRPLILTVAGDNSTDKADGSLR